MYPMIPCGNCGGGIQFVPQLAGCGVLCPYCGVTVQMPGGNPNLVLGAEPTPDPAYEEPQSPAMPSTGYQRVRRRKDAPIWPGVVFGSGLATLFYFGFLKDSSWLVINLQSEHDTVPAAMWRKFTAGLDGPATSGLVVGGLLCLFGAACFLLGRKTKAKAK